MACRTIANCTHQRSSSLVLHHFSRGVNGAALDRYSTIRSFFSRQSESTQKQSGPLRRLHVHTYVTGIHPKLAFSPKQLDALLWRRFHTPSAARKQWNGQSSGRRPAPEKPLPSNESPLKSSGAPLNRIHQNEGPLRPHETSQSTADHSASDPQPRPNPPEPPPNNNPPLNLDNYSRFFRRLALSLPHLHRPTRDDFLNVASGFWQRMRIRFKWFTIKSFRKFNADDISAFITWFLMSQTLWILVGT